MKFLIFFRIVLAYLLIFCFSCNDKKNIGKGEKVNKPVVYTVNKRDTIEIRYGDSLVDISWGIVTIGDTINTYIDFLNSSMKAIIIENIKTGDGGCYIDINGNQLREEIINPNENTVFRIKQLTKNRKGLIKREICLNLKNLEGIKFKNCFNYSGVVK